MSVAIQDKFAEAKQHFTQLFSEQEQALNGAKKRPLYELRKAAISKVPASHIPTRRDEDWKYTALTRVLAPSYHLGQGVEINKDEYASFLLKEKEAILLVFVNGQLERSQSELDNLPEGLTIKTISEALADDNYQTFVAEQLNKWNTPAGESLVTLNTAFAQNGIFINVESNAVIERPIHLLYLKKGDQQKEVLISPQLLIKAGVSSQVQVVETYTEVAGTEEEAYWTNGATRVWVDKNAQVSHYKLQNQTKVSFQTTNMEVHQERDSTFSTYTIDLGGRLVRNNLSVFLKDQNTYTNMYGIYLANEQQHIDNQSFIDHAFPHCESNELYKGILDDKAVGVFNGKVMVRQDAQKTNAFQQNSSLVLSENAKMDSKPQLEIFADDVKCSHGATIGQLDEEPIYYLRSRGLKEDQAKSLLQFAFLAEVLEAINIEGFKAAAEELIQEKLA